MKIENLFVTWQQRSAQSNMPISVSAAGRWGQQAGPFCSALVAQASLWQGGALELRARCVLGMVLAVELFSELLGLLGSSTMLGHGYLLTSTGKTLKQRVTSRVWSLSISALFWTACS